ncbi:MAG: ABC transporter substrate-binding protein [Anaerolineae bacterium]
MIRHILWQAALAFLGIILVFIVLFQIIPAEEPPVETVEVPAKGGTYVEGVLGLAEVINPILAPIAVQANPVDQDLSVLVFDGLTAIDETGLVVPALAEGWEVAEDGSVYEFRLRQDVTWHDGAPFTAGDVAFTVQAMQDPGYQGDPNLSELWKNVTVYVVDDYTVRFTLDEPFPSFLYYTTVGLLPLHLLGNVPAAELPSHPFSTEEPVGTGRFKVVRRSPDQVVLAVNPDHWRTEEFYLEEVAFWFYGDWDSLLVDYEQGVVHGFHPPGLQELAALVEMPSLHLYSAQSAGYGIVYLNLQSESLPFFQEKEVRQALLYLLDRQALIDESLQGQGVVAHSPVLPTTWAYEPTVQQYGYDPERAVGLLDASGWQDTDADMIRDKEGVALAFTLLTSEDPVRLQMAQQIAEQWRVGGVDVTVRPVSSNAETDLVWARDYDAALIEVSLSADPDPYPLWHSTQGESGQNFSGFANEEADLLMEAGRVTIDREERAELYRSFQHLFAEEVPSLLIYYPIYTYAVDEKVEDVQLSPMFHASDRFRNVANWYMRTEDVVVNGTEELDKSSE